VPFETQGWLDGGPERSCEGDCFLVSRWPRLPARRGQPTGLTISSATPTCTYAFALEIAAHLVDCRQCLTTKINARIPQTVLHCYVKEIDTPSGWCYARRANWSTTLLPLMDQRLIGAGERKGSPMRWTPAFDGVVAYLRGAR
jgi:hypothetical protein